MHTALCQLKSSPGSPYSQGRGHNEPFLDRELPDAYDERTWRLRLHVNEAGHVFIPPMAFKNCLATAAKFLSQRIPGQNMRTYTKHFESGLLIVEPVVLPIRGDEVQGVRRFVPANGQRGGSKRVWRRFPEIPSWEGTLEISILDDILTEKVLAEHLDAAGKFIGIGVFRPQNNGFFGRFTVTSMTWD